jgi:hypothetical protein
MKLAYILLLFCILNIGSLVNAGSKSEAYFNDQKVNVTYNSKEPVSVCSIGWMGVSNNVLHAMIASPESAISGGIDILTTTSTLIMFSNSKMAIEAKDTIESLKQKNCPQIIGNKSFNEEEWAKNEFSDSTVKVYFVDYVLVNRGPKITSGAYMSALAHGVLFK